MMFMLPDECPLDEVGWMNNGIGLAKAEKLEESSCVREMSALDLPPIVTRLLLDVLRNPRRARPFR